MNGYKAQRPLDINQVHSTDHPGTGFLESIRMGNICAILMERLIVPLNNIVEYYLVETPQRDSGPDDLEIIEAAGSYPSYKAGLEGFYKQVMLASRRLRFDRDILLVGHYYGRPIASEQSEGLSRSKSSFVIVAMATWMPVRGEKMMGTSGSGCLADTLENVMTIRDRQINSSYLFCEKLIT